jgi:hypothetical protein
VYRHAYVHTFIHLYMYGRMSVHVEDKIMLILCLTEHNAMKMYGGVKVQSHIFSTLSLDYYEFYAVASLP